MCTNFGQNYAKLPVFQRNSSKKTQKNAKKDMISKVLCHSMPENEYFCTIKNNIDKEIIA